MIPCGKKFLFVMYLVGLGALLVDDLMGFRWFHGYDKAVLLLVGASSY